MAGESQKEPTTGTPDPSVLTTESLQREVEALKDLIDLKATGIKDVVAEKFNSVDKLLNLIESQRVEQKADCVEASTPVLCADLVWRPAGSLVVGDELITCDDEPQCAPGTRTPRSFRRGVVTANSLDQDDLLRVATPEGDVLCNPQHPFLVLRPFPSGRTRYWHWIKAAELRDGDLLMRAVDVWEVDESWEGGWLAGIIDGEGCMHFYGKTTDKTTSRLTITQRDSETATKIEQSLKSRVSSVAVMTKKIDASRHTPCRDYAVNYRADVMKILGSVRPPRMMIHADRVWEGRSIGGKHRATPLLSVTPAGRGTIARLGVSTGTYIAGGFAVHNTKAAVDAALAAAKEAVQEQTKASAEAIGKSEGQTATQITAMGTQIQTGIKAVADKYDDLKENQGLSNQDFKDRLTRLETTSLNNANNHDQQRMDYGLLVSIGAVCVSIIAVVVVVLLAGPR